MSRSQNEVTSPTRASRLTLAVVLSLVVLLLVIVFIAQNSEHVKVKFLFWSGNLAVGLVVLLSAVLGGVLVALTTLARILQLRVRARRHLRHDEQRAVES